MLQHNIYIKIDCHECYIQLMCIILYIVIQRSTKDCLRNACKQLFHDNEVLHDVEAVSVGLQCQLLATLSPHSQVAVLINAGHRHLLIASASQLHHCIAAMCGAGVEVIQTKTYLVVRLPQNRPSLWPVQAGLLPHQSTHLLNLFNAHFKVFTLSPGIHLLYSATCTNK